MKIVAINHDIKELKEKLREVVKDFTETNEDVHISLVYYEIHTYKKIEKKVKKNKKKS